MTSNNTLSVQNWKRGSNMNVLDSIHQQGVNIVIYDRDINPITEEIKYLLDLDIEVRSKGSLDEILSEISSYLSNAKGVLEDITDLLCRFQKVSKADSFRVLLASVKSNMCKRFHTDINDLRMLCTYSGQGTLWLTDGNINPNALDSLTSNESIAKCEDDIQQVPTGAVTILKGALYPNAGHGVVHRSPAIEEFGGKRLLLRIDTDATQNLWK